MVEFIGAQLGVAVEALLPYAARRQTRQEHMAALRSIYGYRAFAGRGARHPPAALEQAVSGKLGWDGLSDLVAVATRLTDTMSGNPLAHVAQGHGRLRRYAPRMLRALDIQAAPVATPLLEAAKRIRDGSSHGSPRGFLRPASKWHRHLDAQPKGDKRLWEVAVLSHLRDGFRSGDLWLQRSRRHGDPTQALVPVPVTTSDVGLAVPAPW